MKELKGDLWDHYARGRWVAITTNGTVKADGRAVMGRGCAAQAAVMHPGIAKRYGTMLKGGDHKVYIIAKRMFAFPVKHHWREDANIDLIQTSLCELARFKVRMGIPSIVLPRPGCGVGNLSWDLVREYCAVYGDWLEVITR